MVVKCRLRASSTFGQRRSNPRWSQVRLVVFTLVCVLGGIACTANGAGEPQRTRLRLTTGLPGAGFHPLGEDLASAFGRSWVGVDIDIRESPGSVNNVEAIQNGIADVGFAFADVAYTAFVGQLDGLDHPLSRLRGIAVLQLTPLHLVASGTSTIHQVRDLRGRRIGLGPPGSGTALTAGLVLDAFGLGPGEYAPELLRFDDAAARLVAGTLDAIFVNASYPAESVRFATAAGARLIPIRGTAIDRLRHNYPFFRLTTIPAGGVYPGQPATIHTIGVDTVVVCRSDLSEAFVYEFTRRFFDALPSLTSSQQSLRLIDLDQAPDTPIPLHEGAARFYREREIRR
jgi:TRAP transporter TAXI family solute receptor